MHKSLSGVFVGFSCLALLACGGNLDVLQLNCHHYAPSEYRGQRLANSLSLLVWLVAATSPASPAEQLSPGRAECQFLPRGERHIFS